MWAVVLTPAQALRVRGRVSALIALEPIQLLDGAWVLPARVLPALADARPALAPILEALPRRRLAVADFALEAEISAATLTDAAAQDGLRFRNLAVGKVEQRDA